MTPQAIAALLPTATEATQVFDELKAAGFNRVEVSAVDEHRPALEGAPDIYDVAREEAPASDAAAAPFFRKHDSPASSFADELAELRFSPADARHFTDGLMHGSSLVTVDAAPDPARAREILSRFAGDVREAAPRGTTVNDADADDTYGDGTSATQPATAEVLSERSVQLRAERLEVNKRLVRHGQASVRKEVVTEMRTIEVPVTREELVIERQPASGVADSSEPLGAAEEIRIPLSEERVSVEKRSVVLEEVEISKRRVAETQRVTENVRHEELRVERPDERP